MSEEKTADQSTDTSNKSRKLSIGRKKSVAKSQSGVKKSSSFRALVRANGTAKNRRNTLSRARTQTVQVVTPSEKENLQKKAVIELPEYVKNEIQSVYSSFNTDGKDPFTPDTDTLGEMFGRLDWDLTTHESEMEDLIRKYSLYDEDFNFTLSLFRAIIYDKLTGVDMEKLSDAFNSFDQNGDHSLDRKELQMALECLETRFFSKKEIDTLFAEADKNNDHIINIKEFTGMILDSKNKLFQSKKD